MTTMTPSQTAMNPAVAALILREPDVLNLVGFGRSTLWTEVRAGRFPRPVRLAARAVGWRRADVEAWADSRPTT